MAPSKNEKKIQQLCEMGCSRSAAKSSLKACKWDVEEAAMVVFEDKHQDALDIPTDDDEADPAGSSTPKPPAVERDLKGKGKQTAKLPTPEDDKDDGNDDFEFNDDDEDMEVYSNDGGEEGGATFEGSEAGSVDYGDGDAYGFLNTSKDRTETITEVDEPVRKVWISLKQRGEYASSSEVKDLVEAEIFGLQRWLSGCPEGNEQQQLFPLYNTLAGDSFAPSKCPYNCGTLIPHYESDFFSVLPDFKSYLERLVQILQVKCSKCSGLICLACNEACNHMNGEQKVQNDRAPPVLLHCNQLQAVILGVGLYSAEKLWEDVNALPETKTIKSKKRKVSPAQQPAEEDDDDSDSAVLPAHGSLSTNKRTTSYKSGVGYGGASGKEDDAGIKAAIKLQQERDQSLAKLLAQVRVYLPNRDRSGQFKNSDHMPAGQTLAHLRRRFNPIASLLLSAESLSDMSERKELYTEFMAWLEVMSAHENLAGLMGQPIMRPSSITYSQAVPVKNESTSAAAGKRREKIIVFQANPGPRELLERILSQVKVAYRVAKAAKARDAASLQANTVPGTLPPTVSTTGSTSGGAGAAEARRLMDFCETIDRAVTKIDRALKQSKGGVAVLRSMGVSSPNEEGAGRSTPANGTKLEDLSKLSDEELMERYISWVSETKYGHYDWEVQEQTNGDGAPAAATASELGPSYKHYYNKEARVISSYPARNTALMKEHMMLSDSLPGTWGSSVFLKTDENRPDIIKALITGPDGTPYENGCFLFDILLGGSYNQSPPTVKSRTTKGDRYRLNPNLYAEGKVCLSLLGTWSGPGWVPGKSTLLQVLVSIQAMILWAEPIANEPGFEKDLGGARSKAYNANVRRMVVNIAMLEYLKTPPEGFEEIVQTHFRLKARSIKKQLDKWVSEDDKRALHQDSMSCIHGRHGGEAPAGTEGSGSAFVKDVEAVKEYLDKLERGEYISTAPSTS